MMNGKTTIRATKIASVSHRRTGRLGICHEDTPANLAVSEAMFREDLELRDM
jgi:hypothetical protein